MKIPERSRPAVSVLDFTLEQIRDKIVTGLSDITLEAAYLFGSCINKQASVWSDIDLVVVMQTGIPFIDRPRLLPADLVPGIPVDILVYTPEEFDQLKNSDSGFWKTFRDNHLKIA